MKIETDVVIRFDIDMVKKYEWLDELSEIGRDCQSHDGAVLVPRVR